MRLTTVLLTLVSQSWLAVASMANTVQSSTFDGCSTYKSNISDIANTSYAGLVKLIKLHSGTNYRYVVSRPSENRPWILLIHGFPSSSFDWRHQIDYFVKEGYGVIAPDLLGYGGTDNPSDLARFALKSLVGELRMLLDCEGVEKAFAVGHDFGSVVLSRVTTYMAERILGVAFIGVGYAPPPLGFNQAGVEQANNATLAAVGYPTFGYWYFMNDEDVATIMDAHIDSAFTLTYTDDPDYIQRFFCPVGEYKKWLLANHTAPWQKHITSEEKATFKRILAANGGFDGPVKSYKSLMRGINDADEQAIPPAAAKITQPVLLIAATEDRVALADAQVNMTAAYASQLRVSSVKAGHFLQVEQPRMVNEALRGFIDDVQRNASRYN